MSDRFVVMLSVLILVAASGCSGISGLSWRASPEKIRLVQNSYTAADRLHSQLQGSGVAEYPMLAATFVNLNDFEESSALGRLLSEQVASRLSQSGYSVVEVQLRADQLAVRPREGVFALSREIEALNMDVEAVSILVGTYVVVDRQIFVNARVLRTSDGVALASADFSLPRVPQGAVSSGGDKVQPSVGTRLN